MVGVNDEEMEFAVQSLIAQEGGIVLVKRRKGDREHADADRRPYE